MDYTEESKKYVKKSQRGYLTLNFSTFYKDYYLTKVENPLSKGVAKKAINHFFKGLYYKIIVDLYKFKLPVLGDLFYVAETITTPIATYINWGRSKKEGKIVREVNIALGGRKPYYKHERAEKVKHDKYYQLSPISGLHKDYLAGSIGLWTHIHDLLKDPTAPVYRANI